VPTIQPGYRQAVEALAPVLKDLPGKIVAIDGRDGVGKTTLGRYLAWHFNVALIETDLFIREGAARFERRVDEVRRIIDFRLRKPRPVIVEGIAVLQLFDEMQCRPDFLIYAQSREHSTSETMEQLLERYESRFHPTKTADLVLELQP
jgi:adenylate kinase family enzyme